MSETDNAPAIPAQRDAVRVDLSKPLGDLDQAWRLAVMLAQTSMVPDQLRGKPGNVVVLLMTGAELGLSWAQSLNLVYVTKNGRPGLTGRLLLIKLRQAGHDYDWQETADKCTFRLHYGHKGPKGGFEQDCDGHDYFSEFTVEMALASQLVSRLNGEIVARSSNGQKLPWELYRSDMLFWRAASRAVRRAAPEVTLGLALPGDDAANPDEEAGVQQSAAGPQVLEGHAMPATVTCETCGEVLPDSTELAKHNIEAGHVRAELEGIDASARVAEEPGTAQEDGDSPAPSPANPPDDTPQPSTPEQARKLSMAFERLGVDPDDRRAACEAFARRSVARATGLTAGEVARLAEYVSGLHDASQVDRAIDRWRDEWERDDPAGFAAHAGTV